MTILFDTLTQLELEIPPEILQQCWQQSDGQATVKGQWNAFLNNLCLQSFLPWLQSEYAPRARLLWNQSLLPGCWEVVNGTAIMWGNKRIVLLPNTSIDASEFRVPQEWVDISNWVGDYYLAIQVNPDESWMRVWGYTTHEQLKNSGSFDNSDRSYCLDAAEMIQDLSVLWVVGEVNPDETTRTFVENLSTVPTTQAENLLQRLANQDIILPRLELPFHLWGALVANDNWRQQLFQLRRSSLQRDVTVQKVAVNLSRWLQNAFEDSWESIENVLGNASLGFSLRQTAEQSEAIIRRVKSVNLPSGEVFLLIALEAQTEERVPIRLQLRSRNQDEYLPSRLSLKLLSSEGEIIQSVESRALDNIIQLKRFRIPTQTEFSIQIEVDGLIITEDFLV